MEKTVVVSSTTTTSVPAAATGQNNDVQVSFTYSNSNSNNTAGGSSGGTVVAPSTGHNNNNEHENVIKFYEIGPGDDEVTDIKVEVKEEIEMISESDASHVEIKVPDTKHVYGRLTYKDEVLMITEDYVEIGRNSSTSSVHFHVGRNSFVSRKHLRIWHAGASDPNGLTKYNKLFGKKGVGIGKPSPIKSDMDDDDDGLGFIVTDEAGNIIKKRGASDDTGWRKRLRVDQLANSDNFYLICLSKNGVFVDDIFQRKTSEPFRLPARCTLRFPSTNIRILFESFLDGSDGQSHSPQDIEDEQIIVHSIGGGSASNQQAVGVIYSPLEITIPKQQDGGGTGVGSSARLSIKSPYPSPSGTISAANSCPTSPRHSYNDYHNFSYSSQGASNSSNNYQDDFFQPPSTSAYVNDYEKPPYSYAQLIVQSISAAPDKQLTLSGIYTFISKNYPYYRKEANKGWQNSIRHNLSLNRYFIKVARTQDEPGKGSFWRIDPTCEAKLIDQSYKKRRQRGSQIFRPPYGMPRSAPVSPSHIDNSRENSPLQDVMLQSAPGSPGGGNAIAGNSHNNYVGGDIELADDGVETWQTVKITNASSSDVGRDNKKRQSNKPNIITVTNDMYYSVHGDIGANVSTSGEAVITETVETSAVVGGELDSGDRQGAYVRFTESQRGTGLSPQPAEQSTDGGNIEPATTTASADSYGREVCF